jgi:hypothetical protein
MSLLLTPFFNSSFNDSLFDYVDYHATSFIDENGVLTLEVDLPGFKKEDVVLSVKDRFLEIKAQRKNRKLSVTISSYVSLTLSSVLLVLSIITGNIILGVFSGLFIYFAIKELGWIKS